jgi:Holliday junction resolvase RusA-like endonuclease
MTISFTIPGNPQGKSRPRVCQRNGKSFSYTPEKTVLYENLVVIEYQRQCSGYFFEGPLMIKINAYFPIPDSFSKKKRQQCIEGKLHPTKKLDCDNIAKVILDALNGIAYKDDNAVMNLIIHKKWTTELSGCVNVEICNL